MLAVAALVAAAVTIFDRRRALANDRYIKRLEHVRDRIDSALAAATSGQEAVGDFLSHLTPFEDFRTEQRKVAAATPTPSNKDQLAKLEKEITAHLGSQRDATTPIVQNLAVEGIYLYVRFGAGHPIYEQFEECRRLNFEFYNALLKGVNDNRAPEVQAEDSEQNKFRHNAHRVFRETCRQWFVDELPRGEWSSSERAT